MLSLSLYMLFYSLFSSLSIFTEEQNAFLIFTKHRPAEITMSFEFVLMSSVVLFYINRNFVRVH